MKYIDSMLRQDQKDFDECKPTIITQENSSHDNENECVESLKNKNLSQLNSNSESILIGNGPIRENQLPNSDG